MLSKVWSKGGATLLSGLIVLGFITLGSAVQAADDYKDLLPDEKIEASLIRASLSCFQNPLQQIAVTAYASSDSTELKDDGLLSYFVLPLGEHSRDGSEDFLRLSSFVGPLPSESERNSVDEFEEWRRDYLENSRDNVLGLDID